jgi:chaperonin GroEL (HSP60 family)
VRTTLGPKSMLKMLLDPMGGIVLTNDGNAILREVRILKCKGLNFDRSMWHILLLRV